MNSSKLGACATEMGADQDLPPVARIATQMEKQIMLLREEVGLLEERLSPVLSAEPPPSPESDDEVGESPLDCTLREMQRHLHRLTVRLNTLRSRVTV